MNELNVFNFDAFPVRVVMIDNAPWFVAADVCKILEIGDVSKACSRLDEDEKGTSTIRTPGGNQEVLIINESGLYSLTLTSRKPEAKRFKKWITSEVLPQLRKEGRYELKTQNSLDITGAVDKIVLVLESLQTNQLAMKEDLSVIKKDQLELKKNLDRKIDALFNRVQELHGTLSKLHQTDRKLQKQENYHNLHAISQSVAGNLVQVEMNLREEISKDLEKLYSLFEALHYQNLITHKELHNLSILHQSKRQKKGLDASQKADLKVAMQALRLSLGKSDQTIADDLNRDGIPTLTGQGVWTALKVKRFLSG